MHGAGAEHGACQAVLAGRSQAVRLPEACRFDGGEVRIRRVGEAVILEPVARDWRWFEVLAGSVDADFAAAAGEGSE